MSAFNDAVRRGIERHGEKFDSSALLAVDSTIRQLYGTFTRVKVANGEYVRTGRIGITTGWRPAFLLMHRSSDHGSSDVLGPNDRVIAVQRRNNGPYVPFLEV